MPAAEATTGPQLQNDGANLAPLRLSRSRELVGADGMAHYEEPVGRQTVFSLFLQITGTPTAGQIHTNGAPPAAAAITQFAVFNPINSGKNLFLLRFAFGTVSGTPTTGTILHGVFLPGAALPTVAQTNGTVRQNASQGVSSVAQTSVQAVAAGAALTGGSAPVILMPSNIGTEAFAPTVAGSLATSENLDGLIMIPPGGGWVPLLPGVGTTHLVTFGATWREAPII